MGNHVSTSASQQDRYVVDRLQTCVLNDASWLIERTTRSGATKLSRAPAYTETVLDRDKWNLIYKDILEGQWKQIRGEAKAWWDKPTNDDPDRATGKFEVRAGLLQEKYGDTREAAADEIDRRMTEDEANLKEKIDASSKAFSVNQYHPLPKEAG